MSRDVDLPTDADAGFHPPLSLRLAGVALLMLGLPVLVFGWMALEGKKIIGKPFSGLVSLSVETLERLAHDFTDHDVVVRVESLNAQVTSQGDDGQSSHYPNWEAFIAAYSARVEAQPKVLLILNAQAERSRLTDFAKALEAQLWRVGARKVRVVHVSSEAGPNIMDHLAN